MLIKTSPQGIKDAYTKITDLFHQWIAVPAFFMALGMLMGVQNNGVNVLAGFFMTVYITSILLVLPNGLFIKNEDDGGQDAG